MSYTTRFEHNGGAADTTLSTTITAADTAATIASGTNWPTGATGPFWVTFDPGTSNEETCQATLRSGTSLTLDRTKQDGTTAVSHSTGAVVRHSLSATEVDEANVAVNQTVGKVTTAGDILVATGAAAMKRLGIGAAYKALGANAAGNDLAYLDSLASLLTATGDVPYASGANTPARLAIGGSGTFLKSNGSLPAWAAPTAVFYTVHTWAIAGAIAVPSGDTDFLDPMFASKGAVETVVLDKVRYIINSGTSVTFKMQVNGADATGFTSLSCTTTAATTDPADVTLADLDKLAPVVTAVSGSPKNMTITAFLKHTVTVA